MSGTPIDFQSISHAMSALLNLIFLFHFFQIMDHSGKEKNTYTYMHCKLVFTVIKIAKPKTASNGMTN